MQPNNELAQLDPIKAEVIQFVEPVMALTVSNQLDADFAMASLKGVHELEKKIETKRKNLVQPPNDYVKRVNAYAKTIAEPVEKAKAHVKSHLVKWEEHLEKVRAEELKRAEEERVRLEEAEKRRIEARKELDDLESCFLDPNEVKQQEIVQRVESERVSTELALVHKDTVEQIKGMRVSGAGKRWTFEITEADCVPYQYWTIDEKKIREAVKNGERKISGVRIFEETTITAR